MSSSTQLKRYKKLMSFIDANFKDDIDIEKVEAVSHYSYRNINRIFEALHHETIGKYIKRLRLEKAAQYLTYSAMGVADIAHEVGFMDRAAFSKAFRKKYGCSPSAFRTSSEVKLEITRQSLLQTAGTNRQKLSFETTYLPDFEYLFLEYRGAYDDFSTIEEQWNKLYQYAVNNKIVTDQTAFVTEIMDDSDISDHIHLRYNLACILDKPLGFDPGGLFRTKKHKRQKYVKFIHKGSHQSCFDFYQKIYGFWMVDVAMELKDLSTLEFYPNYHTNIRSNEIRTEIYIPVK